MGSIIILDPTVSNKIAAGEIVVNPSSVVKELIENSIDAGSSRISVEIYSGGVEKIKVSDNGWGMDEEDIKLSPLRHATSKLKNFEDLSDIKTMGFRGEALASIAAVSKMIITSKRKGETQGYRLEVQGGKTKDFSVVGCPEGTTVEVENLFYNTPARKKFLKSSSKETYFVNETVTKYALGFPNIAFRLSNNGSVVYQTLGTGRLMDCIAEIFGLRVVENLIEIHERENSWLLHGCISKPFYTKGSHRYQYFYINNRWVANKILRKAVDEAYYTLIPKNRYPMAVLFLNITPTLIDVNADPTKNTVRIKNEQNIMDFIKNSVKKNLFKNRFSEIKKISSDFDKFDKKGVKKTNIVSADFSVHEKPFKINEFSNEFNNEFNVEVKNENSEVFSVKRDDKILKEQQWEYTADIPRIIGQHNASFIICSLGKDLYIVDQHAAHERIKYEEYKKKENLKARQLIFPKKLDLSPPQTAVIDEIKNELTEFGFGLEPFGGNSFVLREVPAFLDEGSADVFLLDVIDELVEEKDKGKKINREDFIKKMACRSSVKAGQKLSPQEMEALINKLFSLEHPLTCPHGRPTAIIIPGNKLLSEFLRNS
ncbi:MAG: DNA mismatch repair endonuclease MutL [Clostridia bacterium]|nr:DNA mismatch repair endonuclease MutL [Clostridia bacterium]